MDSCRPDRERDTHTDTERQTERHTETDRETDRQTERMSTNTSRRIPLPCPFLYKSCWIADDAGLVKEVHLRGGGGGGRESPIAGTMIVPLVDSP